MNFLWAAAQLKEKKPVRRKSWRLGEYLGKDHSLFYCCAHEETYNSPSVSIDYHPDTDDFLAKDWEAVTILPEHGWVVEELPYGGVFKLQQHFCWTEKEAKAKKKSLNYGKWEIKRVTKNLFGWPGRGRYE